MTFLFPANHPTAFVIRHRRFFRKRVNLDVVLASLSGFRDTGTFRVNFSDLIGHPVEMRLDPNTAIPPKGWGD